MRPTKLIPPGPHEYGQEIVLRRGRKTEKIRVKRWSIDFSRPIFIERKDGKLDVYESTGYVDWGGGYVVSIYDWVRTEEAVKTCDPRGFRK